MKLECNVIEDLLPLYLENICSQESKKIVEEHLMECEKCRKLVEDMNKIEIPHIELEELQTVMVDKKNIRKIRKRCYLSSVAMLLLSISIIGIGFLTYHEVSGKGIAFSNLDDIYRSYKCLRYVEDRKFEDAVKMMENVHDSYDKINIVDNIIDIISNGVEMSGRFAIEASDFFETSDGNESYQIYKEQLMKKFKEYEMLGITIENIRYNYSYRNANAESWNIYLSFDEVYPNGRRKKIMAELNGGYLELHSAE